MCIQMQALPEGLTQGRILVIKETEWMIIDENEC